MALVRCTMGVIETQKAARDAIGAYIIIGLVLSVVAGLMIGLGWPGEDVPSGYGDDDGKTGSMVVVVVGAVLGWVGSCSIFVGLVGLGVRYGIEAADTVSPEI